MSRENTSVGVWINYETQTIDTSIDAKVLSTAELFQVSDVIHSFEALSFVDRNFAMKVNDEAQRKLEELDKKLIKENEAEIAKQKLELNMRYSEKIGLVINGIKTLLRQEFSITDVPVIESIIEKSAKTLDDESVEKIFVSEHVFNQIKKKIGAPIISVLGARLPLGVGYGLSDQQIMLEGGRTVIVSDLEVIIDKYMPGGD